MKSTQEDNANTSPSVGRRLGAMAPGLALAVAVAVVATLIGTAVPIVGGPVSGLLIGVCVALVRKPAAILRPGIRVSSRFVLQLSIVILGTQLSLGQVGEVGLSSLPVMLGTVAICLAAAFVFGRLLGVGGDLRTLIAVGTAICGASAIAAVTPVIRAAGTTVAYAISTIFLFNISAVVIFPLVGHLLGMSQEAFGLFAGTAINDTSSVVAAAATFGEDATDHAVVVKLVRTLMIIPICLALAAWVGRRDRLAATAGDNSRRLGVLGLIPWFLVGFVIAAGVNSLGWVPGSAHAALGDLAVFLITVALSAIGLSIDLSAIRTAGVRPLALGGILWVIVAVSSLALQWVSGGF